ncbi:MAG: DUF370 domain-containing protein [Ruminococcus sp.]|nr:DUF370 domain-containing protein [Ruminococcus sp.]
MFLHLGNDYIVNTKDITGIFDIEKSSVSRDTRDFLNSAAKNNKVISCSYEMPKSFIVCADGRIYISQLSCATLMKRYLR